MSKREFRGWHDSPPRSKAAKRLNRSIDDLFNSELSDDLDGVSVDLIPSSGRVIFRL